MIDFTRTTMKAKTASIIDEAQAGRPFPVRPLIENGQLIRWDHARRSAYINEIRSFWLDVAVANMELVEAGCTDAVYDVREALAAGGYASKEITA